MKCAKNSIIVWFFNKKKRHFVSKSAQPLEPKVFAEVPSTSHSWISLCFFFALSSYNHGLCLVFNESKWMKWKMSLVICYLRGDKTAVVWCFVFTIIETDSDLFTVWHIRQYAASHCWAVMRKKKTHKSEWWQIIELMAKSEWWRRSIIISNVYLKKCRSLQNMLLFKLSIIIMVSR